MNLRPFPKAGVVTGHPQRPEDIPLGPGERIIDGEVYYSSAWLNKAAPLSEAAVEAAEPKSILCIFDKQECNSAPEEGR